ncbi:MAG TPA: hypothetical protein VGM53_16850, partial [Streptosporangiaceae bacterium]
NAGPWRRLPAIRLVDGLTAPSSIDVGGQPPPIFTPAGRPHRGYQGLVGQVDGWREDWSAAFRVATTHGLARAKSHLHDGQDVVVPQLVTIFNEGNPFEAAAAEAGARFVEVALLVDIDEHTRRLREKKPASDVEVRIQSSLETSDLMEKIRGHLAEYLHGRPDTIQLDTTGLTIDQACVRLMSLLEVSERAH